MKSHHALKKTAAPALIDVADLNHEDIDLTITALEIYATAIRDEIDDQAEARVQEEEDEEDDEISNDVKVIARIDYKKRLEEVQGLLKKYREILSGLLPA